MKNKKLILVVLSFSMLLYCRGNDLPLDVITWNKKSKLTFLDFKAYPDKQSKNAAYSYLPFYYKFNSKDKKCLVITMFNKGQSWIKYKEDTVLLSHEQTHFNISELYARKLRKLLSNQVFIKDKISEDIRTYYNEIYSELDIFQDLYDKETNFSNNPKCQSEWNRYVLQLLEEYKDYEDPTITLSVN